MTLDIAPLDLNWYGPVDAGETTSERPMKLCIISAALPPKLDGIGDYTALLSTELSKSDEVLVLTGSPAPDLIPNVEVQTAFVTGDRRSVKQLIPRIVSWRPDWVILQYNPFSYGRWGLNLQLPEVMRAIKHQCPQVRIALMVHEPFVPVLDFKHAVMTTWQRWQLFRLGRCADIVTFSIEPWAQKFRSWFPKHPVECLAVGSNIPFIPTDRVAIRAELGISDDTTVLGFFGTAHNSRLLPWVREAAEAIAMCNRKALILYVGPNADVMRDVLAGVPLLATGSLPRSDVSRHFAAMDIHLSPFVDGISSRRGSFLTGLQHGVATVGTYGYNTSPFLLAGNEQSYLLTDVYSLDKFRSMVCELALDVEKRERIGVEAQRLFDNEFAWSKIAMRLRLILHNYSQLKTGRF